MKPILFSTPMVQAILSGNKTQTRRVIKEAKAGFNFLDLSDNMAIVAIDKNGDEYAKDVDGLYATFEHDGYPEFPVIKSKYQVGDILWVRETWCNINKPEYPPEYYYLADCLQPWVEDYDPTEWKWRPSIFMPKAAARIFLRVTDVRAEKLQDITIVDAQAEGDAFMWNDKTSKLICEHVKTKNSYIAHFAGLWDSINAKRDNGIFAWDKNPWVWVYEFERIEKEAHHEL